MNGIGRGSAQALRDAFDASFVVAAAQSDATGREDFLTIRVAGGPYALALAEIAGVHHGATVVPIAGVAAHLIGIAGFRGAVAPVYDLGMWLGAPRAPSTPWIVLARAPWPVGFAFERLERHIRPMRDAAAGPPEADAVRPFVAGVLRTDDEVRPLVRLASIVDAISKLVGPRGPHKER